MANPLKVRLSGATFQGLQTMTDAEMDYAVDVILKNFASTNSGLGTVNIDGATGTSIGTFVDTTRPFAVGDHPVGTTTNSVTYTFKQDITSSASESLTRPVEYSSTGVRQQNDTQLNDSVISRALNTMVTGGVGSYALQPSSPAGTWTSIGIITNTTSAGTNTSTLWRRTNATAPTTIRPLKYQTSPTKSVQQMTDAEIQSLTNRLRNRIIATNIGTYRVQTSAPTPGTWTTVGAAFDDTRNQLTNQNYTGVYAGTYTGSYTGNFAGVYTGAYSRAFTGAYTGAYSRAFAGAYTGTYSQGFTGAYARFRSQGFTGVYTLFFGGVPYGNFTGFYTGFFTGFYAGSYTGFFTGFYAGSYTGFFTGVYSGAYTGNFTGIYTGSYAQSFTGAYTGNYTGVYTGATIQAALETISTINLWIRTA